MNNNCKTCGRVLIVDDEPNATKVLSSILSREGYDVFESNDVEGGIKIIHKNDIDVVISDMKMPGRDGMQFYEYISKNHSDIPLIFLTAYGTIESAIHSVTNGAFYYFIKPPDYSKLKNILAKAIEQRRLKREIEVLKKGDLEKSSLPHIIGNTFEMLKILELIETIKDSESSVFISGETGTGKEVLAKTLHYSSIRKDKPFIAINCAAIPRELIESELFGHEKGAFTGAISKKIGKFEDVSGGTIFLDEIGELELPLQAKLLRLLQEREIERLGSNKKIKVNFRLISSTNRNLKMEVKDGNFREDLFYRINVVYINIPPLRDRKTDIPLFVSEFIKEFCIKEKKILTLSNEVMEIFLKYHWPGNIRQIKNIIEKLVVLAKGNTITMKDLPYEFKSLKKETTTVSNNTKTLRDIEFEAINSMLQECDGNKSKCAKLLGISRKTLYKRLNELRVS